MGIIDKVKDLFSGNKKQVSDGIDKAGDAVKEKAPDQVDGVVDTAAEKAKDAIEGS